VNLVFLATNSLRRLTAHQVKTNKTNYFNTKASV